MSGNSEELLIFILDTLKTLISMTGVGHQGHALVHYSEVAKGKGGNRQFCLGGGFSFFLYTNGGLSCVKFYGCFYGAFDDIMQRYCLDGMFCSEVFS